MTDEARFQALNDAVQEVLRRQTELEARLSRLEAASGTPGGAGLRIPPLPINPPQPDPVVTPVPRAELAGSRPMPARTGERPAIETKVGLTLVNRTGVITLV